MSEIDTARTAMLAVVDEHIRAENEGDLDRLMDTFASDATFGLNAISLASVDEIRAMYDGFGFAGNGSFSNVRAERVKDHVGDNSIVVELMLSGTHTADFQGIPATGREFRVPACAIFDFNPDHKLSSERVYFDAALMLQQLGVISG